MKNNLTKTTRLNKLDILRWKQKQIVSPTDPTNTTKQLNWNNKIESSSFGLLWPFVATHPIGSNNKNKRSYSIGNVSNPLLNVTNNNIMNSNYNNEIINKFSSDLKIDPYYISGLTQADGSFNCGISIVNKQVGKNLGFMPQFDICLDKDSINVLIAIQKYFGCGKISEIRADNSVHFVVKNLKELKDFIIPHFLKYPVFFNKLHAFQLLIKIVNLMDGTKNFRDKPQILRLAISMNSISRRTDEQIQKFFNALDIPSDKIPPKIEDNIKTITSKVTPAFLAGMIDGDGSFYVIFTKNKKVIPALKQCYGKNCEPFEKSFKKYLGDSGKIEIKSNLRIWTVKNVNTIIEHVIPFMDSNTIHTPKKNHYLIWKKVCLLLKAEPKLSQKSLLELVELAYNMNKGGRNRKLTKDQYIELILNT